MSPWGLIGWLLAGLLALAVSLGLYFLGLALGWTPWAAPVLLWVPLLIFGLIRLLFWFVARSRPPRLPALDPSNPFTGQWEAIKSGLNGEGLVLYLLVGDDDEAKRALLSRSLGPAEYQAAPAGPEGLSLWAAEGRAWLNVPAVLWTDRAEVGDPPAAPGGDWGHLLKLLPGFPGPVAGLAVLIDPEKLKSETEALSRRLARKFSGLAASAGSRLPWWLVLHPLEKLPEGRQLEEALGQWPGAGGDLWERPFGLEPPEPKGRRRELAASLGRSLTDLVSTLRQYLYRADCSAAPPPLSRAVLPLAEELEELPLGLLAAELDNCRRLRRLEFRGLYLTLKSGQFSQFLFQHLIPGQAVTGRGPGSPFFQKTLLISAALIMVLSLGLLAWGQWRGREALALAGELRPLLSQAGKRPPEHTPPVAALALSTDLVLKMSNLAQGAAGLYRAPGLAAEQGREDLAGQLRGRLSSQSSPAFTLALADWAGRGLRPLTFPVPQNQASILVPAAYSGEGRRRAFELTGKWTKILDERESVMPQGVQAGFDQEALESWRRAAEDLDAALIVTPKSLRLAAMGGLSGCAVGPEFLEAAGGELSFLPWAETPQWVRLARELSLIKSWTGAGDLVNDGQDFKSILKRLRRPDLPLGPEGVEKLMAAGQAWQSYESALAGLSVLAQSPKGLSALAEEMFSGSPAPPERSSLIASHYYGQEAFKRLEELAGARPGEERDLAARLFLSPAQWLIQGSVAAAAAGLEDEWNRKVILPAKDLSGVERAELLLGEEGAVAAFREGPARPFLDAGPKGYRPAEALGQPFPWSRDFMKFINASQEAWKKSAGGLRDLKVSALLRPVRAEGALVVNHPLGVRLALVCEAEQFQAETFNRPATFQAQWTPQECGPLALTVIFRDFKLTREYAGPAGFNEFIKSATQGELRLKAEDFLDRVHLFKASGVEAVVLAIDLERGPELIKTLNTPLPKLNPPTRIIAAD